MLGGGLPVTSQPIAAGSFRQCQLARGEAGVIVFQAGEQMGAAMRPTIRCGMRRCWPSRLGWRTRADDPACGVIREGASCSSR